MWKRQKNGLPRESVLTPFLCNIYTNDQPRSSTTSHFLYADVLAIARKGGNFEEIEETIKESLVTLAEFYKRNRFIYRLIIIRLKCALIILDYVR